MPVVFVHGARTSRTMWRAQLAALDAAGVDAAAVDLPAHGERRGERFTVDGAVAVVHDAVDALGGRALVVGLSLGGYVAIEHRARYPEQSAGLVASGCCTPPQSRLRDAWTGASRLLERSPGQGAWLNDRLVGLMLDDDAARDVAAGGYALDAMTDVLREVGGIDSLAALRRGTSPVWIVNGRWDHFRGGERRAVAAARASGAPTRLVIVPHARHTVSLDAPVAFARVILEAAARCSQPTRA
ncbi:hydrolase or acyltransferase (alpha/beta hydrolase superfamily)-like protein [Xylanimonas cellulosilytica DSM 15894]|uniref:Hydrolase or acyltransferase (Alpha/beta hydrolase superfamily)-like protein n=1 Tax=Xylanimonas cellulosilytica (strain DSM 15894 / JCM 12276 / CECT 5975 / KCTC 9989 / LMG 20990 / NBRC 107835 / XIL07) TaxID=446471 RepID=D1BWW3_XYLCX|nr:alpha/beta hydrolase [Xylanimonas cellulosilytica]ACZ29695.1 hydrolase or acyltransferase (alpha/beta hydrolase superfamily)-like protein [Xylanimonas cellulosilytica DSM 15894]